MIRKKGSLKKRIFSLWLCVMLIVGIVISVYTIRYARIVEDGKIEDTQLLCNSYAERLENDLHMMQEQINWYFTSDSYYRQVAEGITDNLNNLRALTHIKNNLTIQALILDFEGGYFFYNSSRDELRSAFHGMDSVKMIQINRQLKQDLSKASDKGNYLNFFSLDGSVYILSSISVRGCQIGYLMNLTEYFQLDDETQIIYVKDNEIINSSTNQSNSSKLQDLDLENMDIQAYGEKIIAKSSVMNLYKLELVMIRDYSKAVPFWQQWNFWLSIIVVAMLMLLFSLFFYHTMRQTLLIPIHHILFRVNEMKAENDKAENLILKTKQESQIEEYQEINYKIDQIFSEIKQLEEERLKEKLRANEAQLQYYQLQTDPHFYLNCLNTISTLLQNEKKEVANDMIIALSGHFRYMFRKSRSLVLLKEELEEVQDYCRIYNIRNGIPLLVDMDVSKSEMLCKVPILCIQTFVENAIKYYGKNGQMLQVRIQIRRIKKEDKKEFLKIRITDNGVGYTKENLDEFNKPVDKFVYKSSHVGIDNLKYRFKLIFENEADIYFYNAPYSGAVVEMTIPVKEDDSDENINN